MALTQREVKRLLAFASEIKKKRTYLLLISLSLAYIGSGILLGFIPTLSTNYFVSQFGEGDRVSCVDQPEGQEPDRVCKEAHTIAVCWDAGKLLLTHLFLAVIINAFVQRYSQVYGRKFFIIAALASALLPPVIVILHLQANIPFFWFYLAKAVELAFALDSLAYVYVSDAIEEASSDMAYVVYLSIMSVSSFVGVLFSATGVLDDAFRAAVVSLALIGLSIAFMALFVPESLSSQQRLNGFLSRSSAHADVGRDSFELWIRPFQDMYTALKMPLENDGLFAVMLVYFISEAIDLRHSEFELQYLQEVAGFGTWKQSTYLAVRFIVSALVYAVLFPIWSIVFGRTYKDAFAVAIVATLIKFFGLIFVHSAAVACILQVVGALDVLATVMMYRVMEHHCPVSALNSLRSAVLGLRSIAMGLSPLFHALLYALFRHSCIYFPAAPIVSFFAIGFLGLLALLNIRVVKYGFLTPHSTFLQLLTSTFFSDDEEEFDACVNLHVSGRGYCSEEDTNGSTSSVSGESEELDIKFLSSPFNARS